MIPYSQQAYSRGQGTSQITAFAFESRDPTANDTTPNYPLYSAWVNTTTKAIWYLEEFLCSNGVITSQWRAVGPIVVAETSPTTADNLYPIGQNWINTASQTYWGLVSIVSGVATWVDLSGGEAPGILTLTGNVGGAVSYDMARNINILGADNQVVVTGNPSDNTLTISLAGGTQAVDSVGVDTFTGPGTNPVLPTTNGLITVTGAQIAAGSTANVIRTDSLAANTYTVQVQRSEAVVSSNAPSNGVSHFNSSQFTVDSNGFVSIISSGGGGFTSIVVQVFTTSGTYTPTTGMSYCTVELVGGGGGGGGGINTNGSSSSGGGSGAYCRKTLTSSDVGASQVVTIGAGGASLTMGGDSKFGSIMTAGGGGEGVYGLNTYTIGGLSGVSSGGDVNADGGDGGPGLILDSGVGLGTGVGGYGGDSFFGGGGLSLVSQLTPLVGSNATNYGGGGGGAVLIGTMGGTYDGGTGSSGICVITEYVS